MNKLASIKMNYTSLMKDQKECCVEVYLKHNLNRAGQDLCTIHSVELCNSHFNLQRILTPPSPFLSLDLSSRGRSPS